MKTTQFKRTCPKCDDELYYSTSKCLKTANKLNKICKKCSNVGEKNPNYGKTCPEHVKQILKQIHTGKIVSEKTREKMSKAVKGEKNPMFGKTGNLCPSYGIKKTDEVKKKISNTKTGVSISVKHKLNIGKGGIGRIHSDETKKKMRISKINHIIEKNGSVSPQWNINGCKFFEQLEINNNWNGMFGTKTGEFHIKELGYFVDYYEPTHNIVIEYDEPLHYNVDNTLKQKDYDRMLNIKNFLKCKFFRYNERLKELKEY